MILIRAFSICTPLAGVFFSPIIALFIVTCALACKGGTSLYSITLGIPTLITTLCWSVEYQKKNWANVARFILNVILPISCMVGFFLHPVGRSAFPYTLYWIIPVGIFATKSSAKHFLSELMISLRITFITHAVGSILWLYTVPTTHHYWLALIPLVAIERLFIAGATTGVLYAVKTTKTLYDSIKHAKGEFDAHKN